MNWIDQLNQSIEYIESNLEIFDCRLDGMRVNEIDISSLLWPAILHLQTERLSHEKSHFHRRRAF